MELAMMTPLLLLIFVVAVDFSRVYSYSQTLTDCARNGAVYLSNPDRADKSEYATVEAAALAGVGHINPPPEVTMDTGADAAGNPFVAVTVSYPFRVLTRLPGMPSEIKLRRTAVMRLTSAARQQD